ncbi:AAA family ATPase [Methanobrevibacter sp.]|uniref:AAA family ATPase n=1 Tax=Methanobrevibacter sp. TaxID=66852 RepID=UPI00388F336F
MTRGLGKGLDSLIPEFYDENFDSNGAQSLEDMLNDDDPLKETKDDVVNETTESNEEVVEESGEETIVDDKDDIEEERTSSEEGSEDSKTSEEISSDNDTEESIPDAQDVKTKENVAEVLDIVDKNPRITLWSSRSAAVFRYLRKTEPEFSISREASILIDEAVSKKYPDIWELFDDL